MLVSGIEKDFSNLPLGTSNSLVNNGACTYLGDSVSKMRRRLAKKIQDHKERYSRGKYLKALQRLGWKLYAFKPTYVALTNEDQSVTDPHP